MAAHYLLRKHTQYHFALKASNNETILTSETYEAKVGALNGIESVKRNSPDEGRYSRLTSKDNKPYFVLKAANGEIIGTSETYSSTAAREAGIASCKVNGSSAPTVDNS
jgi:uncharacterized protein YegP (UPF0339 family)